MLVFTDYCGQFQGLRSDVTISYPKDIPPPLPPKTRSRTLAARTKIVDGSRPSYVANRLYSRKLPSPPVAKRLRSGSTSSSQCLVKSQDDASILQTSPSQPRQQPTLSCKVIANHLTKQFGSDKKLCSRRKLFCPLCPQTFGFPFNLESHLLSSHNQDLVDMSTSGLSRIKIENCPYCAAQYLKKSAVIRHLVCHHSEHVIRVLYSTPSLQPKLQLQLREIDSPLSNESVINCCFCPQRFRPWHKKLLMLHIEKKHLSDLESIFFRQSRGLATRSGQRGQSSFTNVRQELEEDHVFLSASVFPCKNKVKDSPSNHDYEIIDGDEFDAINWSVGEEKGSKRSRAISSSGDDYDEHHGIKTNDGKRMRKKNVRRAKRSKSDISHCPSSVKNDYNTKRTEEDQFTRQHGVQLELRTQTAIAAANPKVEKSEKDLRSPTPISQSPNGSDGTTASRNSSKMASLFTRGGSGRWSLMRRKNEGKENKDPVASKGHQRLFKCNLCGAAFVENAFLLVHLKNKHHSMERALRPTYCCGGCPAKFFKNRFLVKHVESHQFELVKAPSCESLC